MNCGGGLFIFWEYELNRIMVGWWDQLNESGHGIASETRCEFYVHHVAFFILFYEKHHVLCGSGTMISLVKQFFSSKHNFLVSYTNLPSTGELIASDIKCEYIFSLKEFDIFYLKQLSSVKMEIYSSLTTPCWNVWLVKQLWINKL